LAKAFVSFKKETEHRLQQMESGSENSVPISSRTNQKADNRRQRIDIEIENDNTAANSKQKKATGSGTLNNMLNKEG
jgi:hypothetical protein